MEDDAAAEDEVESDDVKDDEVKGEEDIDVENKDVEEAEDDDVEEEDRSQDPDPHSGQACIIKIWNALGHFTKATSCDNSKVKCRRQRSRTTLCASLRSALEISRKPFSVRMLMCNAGAHSLMRGGNEMHLDISQKPLCART